METLYLHLLRVDHLIFWGQGVGEWGGATGIFLGKKILALDMQEKNKLSQNGIEKIVLPKKSVKNVIWLCPKIV